MRPLPSIRPVPALIILLIVLSLSWTGSLVQARENEFMGRIVRVEGYGIIVRMADGREVPANAGLDLFSGDKVSAGPLSEIRIITVDGSLFWLGGESVLELGDLETSDKGSTTTLTLNLPAGYLKTVAESYDKSKFSTVQVWTENAMASISEDAMIVIESLEGTKVIGFGYPAKVYGREHPDKVETTMDEKVCLVPGGQPALPPREMTKSERFLFNNLFILGSTADAEPERRKKHQDYPPRFISGSTTTTTTTTGRPTTTTIITTTSTTPTTTTTLLLPQ